MGSSAALGLDQKDTGANVGAGFGHLVCFRSWKIRPAGYLVAMSALTRELIEEIKSAPEAIQRELLNFLTARKTGKLSDGERHAIAEERADWLALSSQGLARAYGSDEPDYPDSCIKERNPAYDGR